MGGRIEAIGSALSRGLAAIVTGRMPRFTLSAEASWMARFGDRPGELKDGAEQRRLIDRLPFNGPGHCDAACDDHLKVAAGRLARVAEIEPETFRRVAGGLLRPEGRD